MAFVDFLSHGLIVLALPLALVILICAHDAIRTIIFVLSAFFWLIALLITGLLWVTVDAIFSAISQSSKPENTDVTPTITNGPLAALIFSLFFSIVLQEASRFGFFILFKFAKKGILQLMDTHSIIINSLIFSSDHLAAFVCGLGFGTISSLISVANLLTDLLGPGAPGFELVAPEKRSTHTTPAFPLVSCLSSAALPLLHICWSLLLFEALYDFGPKSRPSTPTTDSNNSSSLSSRPVPEIRSRIPAARRYVLIALVILSHFLISFASLFNQVLARGSLSYTGAAALSLSVEYITLLVLLVLVYACTPPRGMPRLKFLRPLDVAACSMKLAHLE